VAVVEIPVLISFTVDPPRGIPFSSDIFPLIEIFWEKHIEWKNIKR
jgi:hypothetical protein